MIIVEETPAGTDRASVELTALALAARSDDAAMASFVAVTSVRVWRACAALVDPASADDLTQETYLRAVRALPSYRGDSSPLPWLITIARRVCAEEIATRQRRRELDARLRLERRDTARDSTIMVELSTAIDGLAPERREAFVLTAIAGVSYADAAAACGCPVGTIRSRVARARDDLVRTLRVEAEVDDAIRSDAPAGDAGHARRRLRVAAGIAVASMSAATLVACSSVGPTAGGSASASKTMATHALAGTASARIGDLRITGGYIPQPASPDVAAAYFTVRNTGAETDTLARVTTNVSGKVMAMNETEHGTTGSMTDLPKVSIPAHGSFRFTQGHAHLMLEHPTRSLRQGDKVSMTITFAHAGTVRLHLPVVPLTGPTEGPMSGMSGMDSGN